MSSPIPKEKEGGGRKGVRGEEGRGGPPSVRSCTHLARRKSTSPLKTRRVHRAMHKGHIFALSRPQLRHHMAELPRRFVQPGSPHGIQHKVRCPLLPELASPHEINHAKWDRSFADGAIGYCGCQERVPSSLRDHRRPESEVALSPCKRQGVLLCPF